MEQKGQALINFTDLGYNSTEIPYGLIEEDLEFALMIRKSYKVRDLVKVWYNADDGKQYAVKGGLSVIGLQHLYIKGLTEQKFVAEQIIHMSTIVDIQPEPDQLSPYDVELQLELAATRWEATQKSSYEERTLMALKAANGVDNAGNTESNAAGEGATQGTLWDEDDRAFGEAPGTVEAQAAQEDSESGYPVRCARCGNPYMNLTAYWNHLDEHDMATMEKVH